MLHHLCNQFLCHKCCAFLSVFQLGADSTSRLQLYPWLEMLAIWESLMNWFLHKFTQYFKANSMQNWTKRLNWKWKYRTQLFVIRSLLFKCSNIIRIFKKDQIQISLFGLLLFKYSNNELFVATLLPITPLDVDYRGENSITNAIL